MKFSCNNLISRDSFLGLTILLYLSFPLFPEKYGTVIESILYFSFLLFAIYYLFLFKCVKVDMMIFFYFSYLLMSVILSLFFDESKGWLSSSGLIEIFKVISYFIIFVFFYNYGFLSPHFVKKEFVYSLFFVFSFFSIFNMLDIFLNDSIFTYYSFLMYKRESVSILSNMAVAPFTQTYHYAAFLLIGVIYSYTKFIKDVSIINFFLFSLFSFSLLLSQSRTAFLAYCAAVVLISIFYSSQNIIIRCLIGAIISVLLSALFTWIYYNFSDQFSYIISGFSNMLDGTNNSVNTRSSQIEDALSGFLLIGSGIAKEHFFLESVPALYLWRYGLIGLFLFYSLVIYMSYVANRLFKISGGNIIFGAFSIWFLIYPIMSLSSAHHDTPKLALVFYGSIGLILSHYKCYFKNDI